MSAGDFAEVAEHAGDVLAVTPVASLDPVRNRRPEAMKVRPG